MKGLRLYIPPFAPDDSGAAAILHNLNCMSVIIDAGGCAGNIAGFDEPRKDFNAVFSAGLRDMDAILGRDDRLIEKLIDAKKTIKCEFIALIGTPVPAVIGTDFFALKRIIEKKLNLPVIAINTDGTRLYDEGISKTYTELFKIFAKHGDKKNLIGVLGASHFDFPTNFDWESLKNSFDKNNNILIYGFDGSVESFRKVNEVFKNIVVSVSGISAARFLEKNFGIPYEIYYPFIKNENFVISKKADKILIIHEQFHANALRDEIRLTNPDADIRVGTWFLSYREFQEDNDAHFDDEEKFIEYVKNENFDIIIADKLFSRALHFFRGEWIHLHHFAVSGSN